MVKAVMSDHPPVVAYGSIDCMWKPLKLAAQAFAMICCCKLLLFSLGIV